MSKGHIGRPSIGEEALTEICAVRLSKAEKDAIKQLQINFTELARKAIQAEIAKKSLPEGLQKAS